MFTVATLIVLFLSSFISIFAQLIVGSIKIAFFAASSNNEQEKDFKIDFKTLTDVEVLVYSVCLHFRNFALCINLARWYLIVRQNKV